MHVACVGGVNLDLKARAVAPLAMASSNPGRIRRSAGGVAGNVAAGLARLGVAASLFSVVGDDPAGHSLIETYGQAGIDVRGLTPIAGAQTATYSAVLDQGGELVVAIADAQVLEEVAEHWVYSTANAAASADVLFLDANLPEPAIAELVRILGGSVAIVADPVSAPKAVRFASQLADLEVLFPDRAEAETLTGIAITDDASAEAAAADLRRRGVPTVVLKLGHEGVLVADSSARVHYPVIAPDRVHDVTGAGDALAAGYLYGHSIGSADPVEYGLAAASLTVESGESIAPSLDRESIERRRVRAAH